MNGFLRDLDDEERSVLGNRLGESQNMDDTGFFSIQVLQRAVNVFDLELVPYASQHPIAQQASIDPLSATAYICNLREHWFTIRRFGSQFFDLNSISTVPKLISDTYLSLYLTQLRQSGYSIFVVNGVLPTCTADEKLAEHPLDSTYYRSLIEHAEGNRNDKTNNKRTTKSSSASTSSFDEQEIQRAIKASVELDNSHDKALQQVLAQSLRDAQNDPNFIPPHEEDPEAVNQRLLDQAIAASLKSDMPITTTTTTQPTAEGTIMTL